MGTLFTHIAISPFIIKQVFLGGLIILETIPKIKNCSILLSGAIHITLGVDPNVK